MQFQRIARRDKKAFLIEQCIEIEVNNRIEKTGDLYKKIRDTKGTFPAKMVTVLVSERAQVTGGNKQLHFYFGREQGSSLASPSASSFSWRIWLCDGMPLLCSAVIPEHTESQNYGDKIKLNLNWGAWRSACQFNWEGGVWGKFRFLCSHLFIIPDRYFA